MVSRIIKCIEDLDDVNQHRITRETGSSNYFLQEARRKLRLELGKEKSVEAGFSHREETKQDGDDSLMSQLKTAVAKFVGAMETNPGGSLKSLTKVDEMFAELLKDVQPVKSAILSGKAKDSSEWTKAFGAAGSAKASGAAAAAAPEAASAAASTSDVAAPVESKSEDAPKDELLGAATATPEAGYTAEAAAVVPPSFSSATSGDMLTLTVETMSGNRLTISCAPTQTLSDLKEQLHACGGPEARDQKIVIASDSDHTACRGDSSSSHTTLAELGLKSGDAISLLCVPYCDCCRGVCNCIDCHGQGRYIQGCETCGHVRPPCEKCKGECKCFKCHGEGHRGCNVCGRRPPCWGGDTFVLHPDGSTKKIRDCKVGDEVRTLLGSKRIARIWGRDPSLPQNIDTEVTCLDGVWITSHHPVINGDQWAFPADFKATAPWSERQHIVPDMYNFELEGHDDTILLWGGGGLVVSCTIGKYLGPRFGYGICTRRSTRCQHDCPQCDAVYMEGLAHNNIPSELRWARFPGFPQVEWPDGISEFELAAAASHNFVPPRLPTTCSEEAPTMIVITLPLVSVS